MTKRNDKALPPREEGTVYVADLPALAVQQIAALPASELARLQQEAEANLRIAKSITASLDAALDHRYGSRARQVRVAEAKDTGTVRFDDNGFTVVAELPKRVDWDQHELTELVERIKAEGEDPRDYVEVGLKVSERKFAAWPSHIRKIFQPARNVRVGKETFQLIHAAGDA